MRVVFDANILIAAFMFRGGMAEQAMQQVLDGYDDLLISRPLITEVLGVLGRKFGADREELSRLAVFLSEVGVMVSPELTLTVLQDEPDNRILEVAVEGRADLIVTGDKKMLKLMRYDAVRILSLRAHLELAGGLG